MGIRGPGATRMLQALLPEGAAVYLGLFEDVEATTEVTADGYARVADAGWVQGGDGLSRSNAGPIEWPAITHGVTVGAVGVFDAPVGGELLHSVRLSAQDHPLVLEAGDYPRLPTGAVTATLKDL